MIVRKYYIKKNEGNKDKIDMNTLFMGINSDLIYGVQGSINMRGEELIQI